MSDRNLSDLDPKLQPLCQQFLANCKTAGLRAIITQTWRSYANQDADYACGRTAPGNIITNARGGLSPHNCTDDGTATGTPASKAFDFALYDDGDNALDWDASDPDWQKAIAIGEALGLISGSTWHSLKDSPHFELPNWNQPTV
jgi:peptidoglycan L-alanyl-D-glutamate endopeptidase CwlK